MWFNNIFNHQAPHWVPKVLQILIVFDPGTLESQPDTYLVPVNYVVGLGVWHIDAYSIY